MKDNNEDLSFLENYKIFAFIALGAVILIYLFLKIGLKIQIIDAGDMGTIGDFFGGLLNPIFALLALFALLSTIKIQSKALKISSDELVNSRKELELTRDELSKSAIAQEEQSKSIKVQNFENTFFNMISLHNEIINNILLEHRQPKGTHENQFNQVLIDNQYTILGENVDNVIDDKDYKGKKALSKLIEILNAYQIQKKEEDIQEIYANFNQEYSEVIGNYFNSIHQILKFIADNKTNGNIEDTETYSELFNSQFLPSELELLFFHCALSLDIKLYSTRKNIAQFSFFNNLLPNKKHMTKQMVNSFNKSSFGNNFAFQVF